MFYKQVNFSGNDSGLEIKQQNDLCSKIEELSVSIVHSSYDLPMLSYFLSF